MQTWEAELRLKVIRLEAEVQALKEERDKLKCTCGPPTYAYQPHDASCPKTGNMEIG